MSRFPTHDANGYPWAKLSKLSNGSRVRVDACFTCMTPNSIRVVTQADDGLWISCSHGRHYLVGQADDGEHLVGIYQVD